MEENTYRWPPQDDGQNPAAPKANFKKLARTILIAVIAIAIGMGAMTCFYTVDDKQQAVVTTFGKVTDVTDAGVHFKLPFGIQNIDKVDVNVYQKIELGYSSNGYADTSESTMITGDYNIVNVDFFVEYKISDPVAYLYSSNEPEENELKDAIDPVFICTIGTTETSLIPGLSGAGASPDLT